MSFKVGDVIFCVNNVLYTVITFDEMKRIDKKYSDKTIENYPNHIFVHITEEICGAIEKSHGKKYLKLRKLSKLAKALK